MTTFGSRKYSGPLSAGTAADFFGVDTRRRTVNTTSGGLGSSGGSCAGSRQPGVLERRRGSCKIGRSFCCTASRHKFSHEPRPWRFRPAEPVASHLSGIRFSAEIHALQRTLGGHGALGTCGWTSGGLHPTLLPQRHTPMSPAWSTNPPDASGRLLRLLACRRGASSGQPRSPRPRAFRQRNPGSCRRSSTPPAASGQNGFRSS